MSITQATEILQTLTDQQKARLRKIIRLNFYMISSQGEKQLKHKYGLTRRDVISMMIMQDGRCALCTKEIESKWDIDHNHKTGKVRGLLHAGCNRGLGQLGDCIEELQKAIDYLRRNGET